MKSAILENGGLRMKKKNLLWKLFVSTFYISAFTFGGGYVIVSLMKKKFVDEYHWIEEEEMLDLIAIAQSSPGAIAVNGAIVVGYKLAGMIGAATAILATILPPFLILSILSVFYNAFQDNFLVSQMLNGMQARGGSCHRFRGLRYGKRRSEGKRSALHGHHGRSIHGGLCL